MLDILIGVEYPRSKHIYLTLSNNKRGTELGMLVVPLDQTFHPLHLWIECLPIRIPEHFDSKDKENNDGRVVGVDGWYEGGDPVAQQGRDDSHQDQGGNGRCEDYQLVVPHGENG